MRKMLALVPLTLTLQACALFAPAPSIATASDAGCSTLNPKHWREGVGKDAPDPPEEDTYGAMAKYADALAALIGIGDDRIAAVYDIQENCEKRDAEALKKATKRGLF